MKMEDDWIQEVGRKDKDRKDGKERKDRKNDDVEYRSIDKIPAYHQKRTMYSTLIQGCSFNSDPRNIGESVDIAYLRYCQVVKLSALLFPNWVSLLCRSTKVTVNVLDESIIVQPSSCHGMSRAPWGHGAWSHGAMIDLTAESRYFINTIISYHTINTVVRSDYRCHCHSLQPTACTGPQVTDSSQSVSTDHFSLYSYFVVRVS